MCVEDELIKTNLIAQNWIVLFSEFSPIVIPIENGNGWQCERLFLKLDF